MADTTSVLNALELAKRELVFVGGCVLTDRPDMPLSKETAWTMDFTRVIKAIDDAIEQLVGADRRADPECEGCKPLHGALQSARTKFVPMSLALIDTAPEARELKSAAEKPEALERHSGCLRSGREGPFAPISLLSNEGRCVQCISTICGPALCRREL